MLLATALGAGQKTAIGTAPLQLVTAKTPCQGVLLCAPIGTDNSPANANALLITEAGVTGVAKGAVLDRTNWAGIFIPINDASKIWVKSVSASAQKCNFLIFKG